MQVCAGVGYVLELTCTSNEYEGVCEGGEGVRVC